MRTTNLDAIRTVSDNHNADKVSRVRIVASDNLRTATFKADRHDTDALRIERALLLSVNLLVKFFAKVFGPVFAHMSEVERTEMFETAAKRLEPFGGILRTFDLSAEDAEKISIRPKRREAYNTGCYEICEVASVFKLTQRNGWKLRARQFEITDNDGNTQTVTLALDKYGKVAPRVYGVGAAWDVLKRTAHEYAAREAAEFRACSGHFTTIKYALVRSSQGVSV